MQCGKAEGILYVFQRFDVPRGGKKSAKIVCFLLKISIKADFDMRNVIMEVAMKKKLISLLLAAALALSAGAAALAAGTDVMSVTAETAQKLAKLRGLTVGEGNLTVMGSKSGS